MEFSLELISKLVKRFQDDHVRFSGILVSIQLNDVVRSKLFYACNVMLLSLQAYFNYTLSVCKSYGQRC